MGGKMNSFDVIPHFVFNLLCTAVAYIGHKLLDFLTPCMYHDLYELASLRRPIDHVKVRVTGRRVKKKRKRKE